MTANYTIISFIILLIIGTIIFLISTIKSRNTYLKYLKVSLPTVAENIINDIIEKKITMDDIFKFINENKTVTEFGSEFFIITIEYIKEKIVDYINRYIDTNVKNKFVAKLLRDLVSIDPSIVSSAVDTILDSSTKEGKEIYNKLLDVIYNHATDTIDKIEEEESKAAEIAEAYENETVEDVAEYNGEFDKSEFEIARENAVEQEYPDEENLDEIPEELVEIVAGSETEEEIELDDESDGEELSFDEEESE